MINERQDELIAALMGDLGKPESECNCGQHLVPFLRITINLPSPSFFHSLFHLFILSSSSILPLPPSLLPAFLRILMLIPPLAQSNIIPLNGTLPPSQRLPGPVSDERTLRYRLIIKCISSVGEISGLKIALQTFFGNLQSWMRPQDSPMWSLLWPGAAEVRSEPMGIVLIIGPFNFPISEDPPPKLYPHATPEWTSR